MTTIDTLVAEAARAGRLTALTLWPSGKGWQANAKNNLGGWNCVTGEDAVAALRAALSGPFITPGTPAKAAPPTSDGGVFD